MEREDEERTSTRLRLLSWNVDMDTDYKHMRTRALISEVRRTRPDVLMLQEVTDEKISDTSQETVLRMLRAALCPTSTNNDEVIVIDDDDDTPPPPRQAAARAALARAAASAAGAASTCVATAKKRGNALVYEMHLPHATYGYFCVLLIRRGLLRAGSVSVRAHAFEGSIMMRGLITVSGRLESTGGRVTFLTSHLESLPMGATRRQSQFSEIVNHCREVSLQGGTAIFAGDTNLREREISAMDVAKTRAAEAKRNAAANAAATSRAAKRKRVDQKVGDAWVMAGCMDKWKYSWDTTRNDNLDINTPYRPRARYDRVFVLGPEERFPRVADFRLVGTGRLEACDKFISDHFGVLVDIDVLT